ncbi:metalloreductase [Cryptococcus bacillisporus CA1873]|uniref:ferric-chelate reductase (NADPH) n=1 Tax=Cryptococcus bacillisporus CA1873 TaxID=1296111 RepID=A0ABR5BFL4_CRYGA|nr:metalloreductase [Cryptococcus bacillisporus CA1873]|eukprot:KIR67937.1 metalloreductase [Cryptococcus gattii CA1873]
MSSIAATATAVIVNFAKGGGHGSQLTETMSPAQASLQAKMQAEKKAQSLLNQQMVQNTWIGLAALFALCWIFILPRFFARASASCKSQRGGGLWTGWLMRGGSRSPTDDSQPSSSSDDHISQSSSDPSPSVQPPTHVRPLLSYIPYSSTLFFARPFQRLGYGFKSFMKMYEFYLFLFYLLLVLFTICWKSDLQPKATNSGSGADYKRSGYVAAAHFPLCIALGVRNNILGLLVGKSYERLKIWHKISGRLMFAATVWHVVAYVVKWARAGDFTSQNAKLYVIYGWVAVAAFIIIMITSVPWARNAFYGIFKVAHILGFVAMLVGLGYHIRHQSYAIAITVPSALVYAISCFFAMTKTRFATAELVAHPGTDFVTLTIPALRTGWRAGQHVRLRVPGTGFVHAFEGHPVTIASAADAGPAVLLIKNAGDWSRRLCKLARKRTGDAEANGAPRKVTVIVEGPYGGFGNMLPGSYSSVLTIAGGSGVTHSLGLAQELVLAAPRGAVRARTVDLVWMVRTAAMAAPLMPTIHQLVRDARNWEARCLASKEQKVQPTALRVHIHITQTADNHDIHLLNLHAAPALDNEKITTDISRSASSEGISSGSLTPVDLSPGLEGDKEKFAYMTDHPASEGAFTSSILSGIVVHPGRPDVSVFVSGIVDETIARYEGTGVSPCGVCVTTCGPDSLLEDVLNAGCRVDDKKQRAVGGLEIEEESFGF